MKLTAADGRATLTEHIREKASAARALYGPLDLVALDRLLADRRFVRYPVWLGFDRARLRSGEFAWPEPLGEHPSAGFRIWIDDRFQDRPDLVPLLVAYHLASVNYGDCAAEDEAELFGATLLGMEQDAYYETLCALVDALG